MITLTQLTAPGVGLPDEIVLMEDEPEWANDIAAVIRELGIKVVIIRSADEAAQYAMRKKQGFYILDIQIDDRREEGLDATQRIKIENPTNFVAIYSGHRRRMLKARDIGADYTRSKSSNLRKDIYLIILQMLPTPTRALLEGIMARGEQFASAAEEDGDSAEADINYQTYQALRDDGDWLERHLGQYVAIVDGEQVGMDENRECLLRYVQQRFAGQPVYFTRVESRERTVKMFSPVLIANQ